MFKITLLLVLAVAGALAQEGSEQNPAPEPYAYAYQTDSSSASEQRSPDGKVTGYYTISDPTDGRQRRVEYIADENGFRAKVETNELGTKSENSADVEVQAAPPSEAQLAYQSSSQQVYQGPPSFQQQVYTVQQQQPQRFTAFSQTAPSVTTTTFKQQPYGSYSYFQQPQGVYTSNYGYGYFPGNFGAYGVNQQAAYGGYGLNGASYNYHTPAQYYSGVQGVRYTTTSGVVQPATYTVTGQNRVGRVLVGGNGVSGAVPAGVSGYSYTSGPVVSSSSSRTFTSSSGSSQGQQGSGNLLVLKK